MPAAFVPCPTPGQSLHALPHSLPWCGATKLLGITLPSTLPRPAARLSSQKGFISPSLLALQPQWVMDDGTGPVALGVWSSFAMERSSVRVPGKFKGKEKAKEKRSPTLHRKQGSVT